MEEIKKIKKCLRLGITKRYFYTELGISAPTFDKRLKDGKFNKLQVEKIKSIQL